MNRAEEFEQLRPLLLSIAHRMLGSVGRAEHAVQETWLCWQGSTTEPASARSLLAAAVTRISIDALHAAQEEQAQSADAVSAATLLLLEGLTPLERAVFLLREVFAFGFPEIAAAIGHSEAACHQLAAQARRHLDEGRPRRETDRREREELAGRFLTALREGNADVLHELLAAEAQMLGDSGEHLGMTAQWRPFFAGADNVLRALVALVPPFLQIGGVVEAHEVDSRPAAIFRDRAGEVLNTLIFDVFDGRIQTIRALANHDTPATSPITPTPTPMPGPPALPRPRPPIPPTDSTY